MPEETSTTRLNDAISGDRAQQLANDLQHQKSRLVIKEVVEESIGSSMFADRVKSIVVEHTGTVEFMKKSQEYADDQIDKRLFKNAKVVWGIVAGWIATGVIAFIVAKLTN